MFDILGHDIVDLIIKALSKLDEPFWRTHCDIVLDALSLRAVSRSSRYMSDSLLAIALKNMFGENWDRVRSLQTLRQHPTMWKCLKCEKSSFVFKRLCLKIDDRVGIRRVRVNKQRYCNLSDARKACIARYGSREGLVAHIREERERHMREVDKRRQEKIDHGIIYRRDYLRTHLSLHGRVCQ
jgi:hypothetical protein